MVLSSLPDLATTLQVPPPVAGVGRMDDFHVALLYSDLIHVADLVEQDDRERANRLSALTGSTGFLQHAGLSTEDPIGHELFNQPTIDAWISTKTKSTGRAALSRFRWWQTQYKKLVLVQELPTEPRARLAAAINEGVARRGITLRQLASETGILTSSLTEYRKQKITISSSHRVRALEEALELLPGTLTGVVVWEQRGEAFCPKARMASEFHAKTPTARGMRRRLRWSLPHDFPVLPKEQQDKELAHWTDVILSDEWRERQSRSRTHPYSIAIEDLPPRVQTEWKTFCSFKTAEVLPRSKKRHKAGRVKREATIEQYRAFVKQFLGWYLLPTREQYEAKHGRSPNDDFLIGAGGGREELTLGLIAVPHLIDAFVRWRYSVRTPGMNSHTPSLLMKIGTLVHPEFGFLTQHPEIVERVPERHKEPYIEDYRRYLEAALNEQAALANAFEKVEARATNKQSTESVSAWQ